MKYELRAAPHAHQSSGRLLRMCLILILVAAWLVPATAMAQSDYRKGIEDTQQSTPARPPNELLGGTRTLDLDSSYQRGLGASGHTVTSQPRKALRFTSIASQELGWASGFDLPGVNAFVFALADSLEGSLYAGGEFTSAGGVPASYIARWEEATSSWHPMGSGMDGPVFSLALGQDGSIYAGGSFTAAGGASALHIARWDRAVWHTLGSGIDGPVSALVVGPDGSLYAGGWFTTAGGVAVNGIALWDGTEWRPLGSGITGSDYAMVVALAFSADGSLYAGGWFTTAGGVVVNHIARWDDGTSSWHSLGSGMDSGVNALAIGSDSSLYAGGSFTNAGGVPSGYIARWGELHPAAVRLASLEAGSVESATARVCGAIGLLCLALATVVHSGRRRFLVRS